MQPLFEHGAKGMLGVLVMVPFMFVGFDVIPQSAEELDIPFPEIGRMLMISIVMAVFWYVLIIAAVSVSLPGSDRAVSGLPTADTPPTSLLLGPALRKRRAPRAIAH